MARIVVIDDDKDWLILLGRLLRSENHEVLLLKEVRMLEQHLQFHRPELVITDIMMPGNSGTQLYEFVRAVTGPEVPIVVCSSTRLKFKINDPKLAYCGKLEAQQSLLPLINSLLESTTSHDSRTPEVDTTTQGNPA